MFEKFLNYIEQQGKADKTIPNYVETWNAFYEMDSENGSDNN
ncbi:hypothetical protein [Paenibacillus sp. BGI2013]|nr:hypothetical protein [Paenibacillus sp. BGI2013]